MGSKSLVCALIGILFVSPFVYAQDQSSGSKGGSSSSSALNLQGRVRVPFALERYSVTPEGFSDAKLRPPIGLEFRLRHPKLWLDMGLSFTHRSIVPVIDVGVGPRFRIDSVEIKFGFVSHIQSIVDQDFEDSQFDNARLGGKFMLGYVGTTWSAGIGGRYELGLNAQLGTTEGLSTQIDLPNLWSLDVEFEYRSPILIMTEFELRYLSFGESVVASPEFAFGFEPDALLYARVGAGVDFSILEFWAHLAVVNGARDETEVFYRTPYFTSPYLLAPLVLQLELRFAL